MAKSIPRTNPLKGGQYRKDTDAYYRSRSKSFRSRNSGLVIKADKNASAERIKDLLKTEAGKPKPKQEGTLNTLYGLDIPYKLDERARRARKRQMIAQSERKAISNLRRFPTRR